MFGRPLGGLQQSSVTLHPIHLSSANKVGECVPGSTCLQTNIHGSTSKRLLYTKNSEGTLCGNISQICFIWATSLSPKITEHQN